MSRRRNTHGGNIIYNNMRKEMLQLRPLNPPSFNARFQKMLRDENPEYTLVEGWKNVQVMEEETTW